jgi:pyruvate formate lyase activating enzyme
MFAPETLALAPSASMCTPLMLDTKRMAIHDGPGMRTTFFVKGCPLKCIWCHNPESIKSEKQIARFKHLCRNCAKCTMDEATCPTRAFKVYGKKWTMDDLVAKALEDKPFYERSGGGVTLSGGEPLFYWDWAAEFFAACKKAGLKTCLDTSLYAPPAAIAHLLPVTDMWLPDYKVEDDALHVKFTGVSNKVIKRNLEQLVAAKVPLEVRMLVVPGCTDGADLAARRRYVKSLGIPDAQIVELEYHDYARSKYLALGIPDTMPPA